MFAVQRSDENELQGKFLPVCFASRAAWVAAMVAPRALVFRLLVKGNEDSGNEIVLSLKTSGNLTCKIQDGLGKSRPLNECIFAS